MAEIKKEPQKHVHKALVDGKEVKKTKFQKALGVFIAEDANLLSESIMDDFIKPRLSQFGREASIKLREFIADSLIGCIQMIIFGNTSKKSGGYFTSSYSGGDSHVNYVSYYNGQPVVTSSTGSNQPDRNAYGVRLVCIPSYGVAEQVRGELIGFIKRYEVATVADYYQLVNITPSRVDWNFGWDNLDGSKIVRYGTDGYIIDFPKPIAL